MADLVTLTEKGLYCPQADIYIDPWRPVNNAVITHAHADHARRGHKAYWAVDTAEQIMRHRLGHDINLTSLPYQKKTGFNGVEVSLHPAGHILGSAQVRLSDGEQTWVIAGDYKRTPDPTCTPFEVVPCTHFVTEATFAYPVYQWQPTPAVVKDIYDWWQDCRANGLTAILFCYSLGKTQRVLAELYQYADTTDTVYLHGAAMAITQAYRKQGVVMVNTEAVTYMPKDYTFAGDLVIAPPSAHRSPWMKKFKAVSTGFASGWMSIRGNRRRRGYEHGFVISDHADWPELVQTVNEVNAPHVYVTHGANELFSKYLNEQGINARPLKTLFDDNLMDEDSDNSETDVMAKPVLSTPKDDSV